MASEPSFAEYVLLRTIGEDGTVNLHAPSCSVRPDPKEEHVCSCAKLSARQQYQTVLESLCRFMRYNDDAFIKLILGGDEDAKFAKLQEMQAYAAQYLQTTMPAPTAVDAEEIQNYIAQAMPTQ